MLVGWFVWRPKHASIVEMCVCVCDFSPKFFLILQSLSSFHDFKFRNHKVWIDWLNDFSFCFSSSSSRSLQINSFSSFSYQFFLVVVVAGCYRHVNSCGWGACSGNDSTLLQLLKKVGRLEIFRHRIVHARDDLVDWLLPWLLGVLSALDGAEELTQRLLDDKTEVWWNLKATKDRVVEWKIESKHKEKRR